MIQVIESRTFTPPSPFNEHTIQFVRFVGEGRDPSYWAVIYVMRGDIYPEVKHRGKQRRYVRARYYERVKEALKWCKEKTS